MIESSPIFRWFGRIPFGSSSPANTVQRKLSTRTATISGRSASCPVLAACGAYFRSTTINRYTRDLWRISTLPQAESCVAAKSLLFDHLIGPGQQCRRDFKAKHLRGLEVDHKLEFGWLYYWQVCWLRPFQDPASIDAKLAHGLT
jgi:hypothetical protein